MGRDRGSASCVYVGNLPNDCRSRDIEDLFGKYGRIKFVDIKDRPSRGPPFAFVEFEDVRDAEDAIRGRDGYDFDGSRLRVEMTKGSGPRGPGGRPLSGGGGSDRNFRGGSRRKGYEVTISGLPSSGSWQDLKDHCRSIGEILFADVDRRGGGVIEFLRSDDAKYCVKKLDDSKFTSHEGETAYIRMKEGGGSRGRDSRSRSRSPRRSRSRSPAYSNSPRNGGGSRSRSPRSRSPSRSRSRS
ncbi:hypothetical protein M3Y97_01092000 [Aphelenchoides bicaudatus]|nr:hypothetical protein M3Y97_01092000 [Aphelenchoides bicaudatus]